MNSNLDNLLYSLPKESKREIIQFIGKEYNSKRGNFQANIKTIRDYLIQNDFRPPYTEENLWNHLHYLKDLPNQHEEFESIFFGKPKVNRNIF